MVQTPTGSPSIDIATLIAVLQQATVSSPAPPPVVTPAVTTSAVAAAQAHEDYDIPAAGGAPALSIPASAIAAVGLPPVFYSSADDVASTPAADDTTTGFVCQRCGAHNVLKSSKDTWYVVTAGRAVGVFQDWHNVHMLIRNVSNPCYKKYGSKEAALSAYKLACAHGAVVVITPTA